MASRVSCFVRRENDKELGPVTKDLMVAFKWNAEYVSQALSKHVCLAALMALPPCLPRFEPLFLTLHFLLSIPLISRRGPILAPRLFKPKMDFFRSTQWAMAPGTYVFTLASLSTLPTLNSSVSFPSIQIQASSHEQTIVGILPCLFPPTLDGSRTPRTDIGNARQISGGWFGQ
jgi:hypothetical protein